MVLASHYLVVLRSVLGNNLVSVQNVDTAVCVLDPHDLQTDPVPIGAEEPHEVLALRWRVGLIDRAPTVLDDVSNAVLGDVMVCRRWVETELDSDCTPLLCRTQSVCQAPVPIWLVQPGEGHEQLTQTSPVTIAGRGDQ